MNRASGVIAVFGWLVVAVPALAFEQGELVLTKKSSTISIGKEHLDQLGPGQILTVLKVKEDWLWVSRGRPGWINQSDVVALNQAEAYFNRVFATGAGASDYLARGNARIASGKIKEGVADLARAVELANDKLPYLEALGYGLLSADDPATASTRFTQLLNSKESASALMGRGLARYLLGQFPDARKDLERAIELEPKHAFPRKYLGALLHDSGDLEGARQQLKVAIDLDRYDLFSRKAAGRLLFEQKRYQSALDQFEYAAGMDPADVEAHTGCGIVMHAVGNDLDGARQAFTRALSLGKRAPENAYLWSNLAQVEMELGEFETALKHLDQAVMLDAGLVEALSLRAYLIAEHYTDNSERMKQADSDIQRVLKSGQPKSFLDLRAMARLSAATGDNEAAVRYQQQACAIIKERGPERFIAIAETSLQTYIGSSESAKQVVAKPAVK